MQPPPTPPPGPYTPRGADAPARAKFLAVGRWASRRLGNTDHERRVAAVAAGLFDLTRDLHRLAPSDRRLLCLAALVHDVGRSVSRHNPPAEGARLVTSDATLPLNAAERRARAYLTLFHKGKVPPRGRDGVLHKSDNHASLRALLSLLRGADALDSRSLQTPRLVFALSTISNPTSGTPERTLRITCYLGSDCPKAHRAYSRRKKFRLLEQLLGLRVQIEITHAQSLRLVT